MKFKHEFWCLDGSRWGLGNYASIGYKKSMSCSIDNRFLSLAFNFMNGPSPHYAFYYPAGAPVYPPYQ